ncbi:MAG: MAPEG family protein [Hydrococcus sp. Prado102]|jgi:uncharacterized membrane protein YecN with MAPEG domain|nr:MAPEG family protein [Hydrococcus sp. Prado102]
MSPFPSLITVLALLVYLILTINVGRARAKYKVLPPATTGDPNFERVLRVQQNTLEQLIFFLPLLWIFSFYISPVWGSGIGAVWIIGRIIFAWGYYQAAEKRAIGFGITSLSSMVLLLGSLVGISLSLINFQF